MSRKHLIIAVAAFLLMPQLASAQATQKFTASKGNNYGLVYSLPVTHLLFQVEAVNTVKKAGPFCNYAKKYLGTDAITEDEATWELKNVSVSDFGVPDKGEQYLMQFKKGATPFLMLTSDGIPLSVNTENVKVPVKKPLAQAAQPTVLDNYAYGQALSGELLASESTAKRAEIAAQQIYKIRESRTGYATGEADPMPTDGEAMKVAIKQLDAQEADLTALFLGTTKSSTGVAEFEYTPTGDVTDEVLFRISDFGGIVSKTDLSGEPVYISIKVTQRGEMPLDEKGQPQKLPKEAVIYKIPGQALVTLKYQGKEIYSHTFPMAQFGINFGLDPSIFTDKKAPAYVKFSPTTGAVTELGTGTEDTTTK